jgi:hypothetical protein
MGGDGRSYSAGLSIDAVTRGDDDSHAGARCSSSSLPAKSGIKYLIIIRQ